MPVSADPDGWLDTTSQALSFEEAPDENGLICRVAASTVQRVTYAGPVFGIIGLADLRESGDAKEEAKVGEPYVKGTAGV